MKLDDKYRLEEGKAYLTGIQALIRCRIHSRFGQLHHVDKFLISRVAQPDSINNASSCMRSYGARPEVGTVPPPRVRVS